jgi:phosphate/sulfate permease
MARVLTAWGWIGLISVSVVLSPILILIAAYELTPRRRRSLLKYDSAILSILSHTSEMDGPSLRRAANAQVGSRYSPATFYRRMLRLEDRCRVSRRTQEERLNVADMEQTIVVPYYRLSE